MYTFLSFFPPKTDVENHTQIYLESCPEGYVLSNVHDSFVDFSCVCNSNNSIILNCDQGLIQFKVRFPIHGLQFTSNETDHRT